MTSVVTKWDDHGSMVSQEEIDQDVADEVSGGVDSRDEVMHSERRRWVDRRKRVTTDEDAC